jgi:sugar phosphate isomerase/epimerase
MGFTAVELPCSCSPDIFDLARAAKSQEYCDEMRGILAGHGLDIAGLSTYFEGQLVVEHPSHTQLCDSFAPAEVRGTGLARRTWAQSQLILAAKASRNLGLKFHTTFSGTWPKRQRRLIEPAFGELAAHWLPILRAFDEADVDLCFELHPGSDANDGMTFERFVELAQGHPRGCIAFDPSYFILRRTDALEFIDNHHSLIRTFCAKDAEFRSEGAVVFGGYQNWLEKPGRFRTLGDGQVDFDVVLSKLAHYDCSGWAILNWEDCIQNAEEYARRGAAFIRNQIRRISESGFGDFVAMDLGPSFHGPVVRI